jgi:rhodanese-related sulfurtransferase
MNFSTRFSVALLRNSLKSSNAAVKLGFSYSKPNSSSFNRFSAVSSNVVSRAFSSAKPSSLPVEISASEAKQFLTPTNSDNPYDAVIDVREADEVAQGMISNAIHIPLGQIIRDCNSPALRAQLKDKNLLIYCKAGGRSRLAAEALNRNGYKATNMAGGYSTFSTLK